MGVCGAKPHEGPPDEGGEKPIKRPEDELLVIHPPGSKSPETPPKAQQGTTSAAGSPSNVVAASPPAPVSQPSTFSLLESLRNQPSLEQLEEEERKQREEEALREQKRKEDEELAAQREREAAAKREADRKAAEEAAERKRQEEEEEQRRIAAEKAAAKKREEEKKLQDAQRAKMLLEQETQAALEDRKRRQAVEDRSRAQEAEKQEQKRLEEERAKQEAARQKAEAERAEADRIKLEAEQAAAALAEQRRQEQEETARIAAEREAQNQAEIARKKAEEAEAEAERRRKEQKVQEETRQKRADNLAKLSELKQRTAPSGWWEKLPQDKLMLCGLVWLEEFTKLKCKADLSNMRNGEMLCAAMNTVFPNSVPFEHTPNPFRQKEILGSFLTACETKMEFKKDWLFAPLDLADATNLGNVAKTIHSFYKYVAKQKGFSGPYMLSLQELEEERQPPPRSPRSPTKDAPISPEKVEFGMHAEMHKKQKEKMKQEQGNLEKVRDWIQDISGEKFNDFGAGLKSGVILCRMMNKIKKGAIRTIHTEDKPFKQRENIKNFIQVCKELGLKDNQVFDPNDLFEKKNLVGVAECLVSLSRALRAGKVEGFNGPFIAELDQGGKRAVWARTMSDGKDEANGVHE